MDITGKIIQILPETTGEGRNGPWKRQEFIISVPGNFARKVCLTVWGDQVNLAEFKENDEITASVDLESR